MNPYPGITPERREELENDMPEDRLDRLMAALAYPMATPEEKLEAIQLEIARGKDASEAIGNTGSGPVRTLCMSAIRCTNLQVIERIIQSPIKE